MSLLQRYVLKRFLQVYLLTACALVSVFLIVDFFERVDEFFAKGLPWTSLFAYYIYKIPFIAFFVAPQAVLLATVIALASFARNNEFTAMKACGIGVTGITLPIVLASVGIALMVIAINEYVAPKTNKEMNHIFYVKVRGGKPSGVVQRDNIWYRSPNSWIWHINYYDPGRSMMKKVSIYVYGEGHFLKERIDASAALWNGKEWEFLDGYLRTFKSNGEVETQYFAQRVFALPEIPADFNKTRKRPEEMSLSEMYKDIQTTASEGQDTSKKWVDLHHKISYPFVSVVMALIGIPLSMRTSRMGGLLFCVGISLALGFAFSFLYAMGISLGHGGTFSPLLAGWGINLIFSSLGFYLLLTLDSEHSFL